MVSKSIMEHNLVHTTYIHYIHHSQEKPLDILNNEHITFLLFWLNNSFVYSKSISSGKSLLPLAILLHEGHITSLIILVG